MRGVKCPFVNGQVATASHADGRDFSHLSSWKCPKKATGGGEDYELGALAAKADNDINDVADDCFPQSTK